MAKSYFEQKCRICGCDWNHACNDHDYWYAEDLCSACAEAMKPILFNTEMVRAILENRKTTTRRVIKGTALEWLAKDGFSPAFVANPENHLSPYLPGDILYVRETWRIHNVGGDFDANTRWAEIEFKAGGRNSMLWRIQPDFEKWRKGARWSPSLFMPKEAARLFLRITGVRAERLQEITEDGAKAEGLISTAKPTPDGLDYAGLMAYDQFPALWDSTVKKSDLGRFGWAANPWVWNIEFERIGRETEKTA